MKFRVFTLVLLSLVFAETALATPVVYFTKDISTTGLMAIYEKLGREPSGKVAVKLSTGEAGNTHYLSPDLIKELVQKLKGTIVECNTAYGGSRSSTAMHRQVAEDHGFTKIAEVDIMDAEGGYRLTRYGWETLEAELCRLPLEQLRFYSSPLSLQRARNGRFRWRNQKYFNRHCFLSRQSHNPHSRNKRKWKYLVRRSGRFPRIYG